jgi:hypothetical protein
MLWRSFSGKFQGKGLDRMNADCGATHSYQAGRPGTCQIRGEKGALATASQLNLGLCGIYMWLKICEHVDHNY